MERTTPKMCECLGREAGCPKCDGTGVVTVVAPGAPVTPHLANLWSPVGEPYVRHHPSDDCTCKLCGQKVKRRKIWHHVLDQHPEQTEYPIPEDIKRKLQQATPPYSEPAARPPQR